MRGDSALLAIIVAGIVMIACCSKPLDVKPSKTEALAEKIFVSMYTQRDRVLAERDPAAMALEARKAADMFYHNQPEAQ